MALISNVPQLQFTPQGVIVPPANDVLQGVLLDFNQAFGGDLSLALSTPQGQLATSLAAIISDCQQQIAYLTNQVDPQYASGEFQDAIGNIYFITRKPGEGTTVTCTVIGLVGTLIPAGTLAKDTAGNFYYCASGAVIPDSGSTTAVFINTKTGAIPCPANTLNIIYQTVIGWDSINNPANGVLGRDVESRQDFEYRRKNSVQKNAAGILNSIRGNVFAIPTVLDVYAVDNVSNLPLTINGVTLVGHSLYVCVYALSWTTELQQQVAEAIWLKKNPGCNYNGDTEIVVYDEGFPYPVKFQQAAPLQIYYKIQIVNNPALPSTVALDIKNAVVNNFNEKIGARIDANNYYGTILSVSPIIQILSVTVGNVPAPVTTEYQVLITQMPVTQINNIIVELI